MALLDILYDFNCNHSWEETLDEIERAVLEYNDAIEAELDPGEFIGDYLPMYWRIVREHNTYRWGGADQLPSNFQYDIGIFLVGFSSLPIVLSIAEIQPHQEIYFLHSPETERRCDEITNRITEMLVVPPTPFDPLICPGDAGVLIDRVRNAKRCEISDPSDPVETFRQIKEIIDRVSSNLGQKTRIALDLTGGKKTMIGGGFTAGSIYFLSRTCNMFYVDSSEYDPDRGAPKPGTEFLSRLDNPYGVYNVQSVQEAKSLFERHNYEEAKRLWKGVQGKLDDHAEQYDFLEDEREEARRYYWSSHCYHPWDALDYEATVRRKTYRVNGSVHEWGYHDAHKYDEIDVLDILKEVENKDSLFACDARVIHYAVDRYQNGRRRMESGKFEDALVRFSQVIEMLCVYEILKISDRNSLKDEQGEVFNAPADYPWKVKPLIEFLFKEDYKYFYRGRDDRYFYQISDPLQRLEITNYDCNDVKEITELIEYRNQFIHFRSPMIHDQTRGEVNRLQEIACKFLENSSRRYCEDTPLCFDKLLKLHEFRRLE